jgi:hypothetical protein
VALADDWPLVLDVEVLVPDVGVLLLVAVFVPLEDSVPLPEPDAAFPPPPPPPPQATSCITTTIVRNDLTIPLRMNVCINC